jgi:hypothetical protein
MLFMVIETFRNQNGKAVYRKLRDAGRGLPDGLKFAASYVTADLGRCFDLWSADLEVHALLLPGIGRLGPERRPALGVGQARDVGIGGAWRGYVEDLLREPDEAVIEMLR